MGTPFAQIRLLYQGFVVHQFGKLDNRKKVNWGRFYYIEDDTRTTGTPQSCLHDLLSRLVPHPYGSHPNCVRAVQSLHSPRKPSSRHPLCQQYFFQHGDFLTITILSGVLVRNTDQARLLHTADPAFLKVKPKNLHSTKTPRVPLCTLKHERFFTGKSKPLQKEHFMMESLVIPFLIL